MERILTDYDLDIRVTFENHVASQCKEALYNSPRYGQLSPCGQYSANQITEAGAIFRLTPWAVVDKRGR